METPPPRNRDMRHVLDYVESSRSQKKYSRCSCLTIFHQFLSKSFHKLGYVIASSPSYFIVIPMFLTLLGATGVQQMTYESDPELLFSPKNGRGRYERTTVEKYFPVDYRENFSPDKITKISHFARIIVEAKDKDTMFRNEVWDELVYLDEVVRNFTIEWDGQTYTYDEVCAKIDGECIENHAMKLNEIMPEVANGSLLLNYPLMLFPLVLPFIYGRPEVNESEGIITSTKAISLAYWLRETDEKEKERAHIWEGKLLEILKDLDLEYIDYSIYVSRALEDELERNAFSIAPYLLINFALMMAFSVFSVSRSDWVRSKFYLGAVAVLSSVTATIASFGFLMYMGVPFIGLNMAAPFLMLGIGLDDMFVVLSAWQRTKTQDDVPVRMAEAYSEAAVSITITSLTNMLSFFVGSITPFPSVQIFCIYTGFSIFMTYLWFLCFFGGCLALAGNFEKNQRHAIFLCKTVKSKSEAEDLGSCYSVFCAGGINKEDPWNPKDNKSHVVMVFCRDYLGRALNIPAIKTFVICIFLLYLGGAIYGCSRVKEGLERRKLALDDSYLIEFFDEEDHFFRKYPYRIQVVVAESLNYSDPGVQQQIIDLHEAFENSSYVGDRMFSRSFIRAFYSYLDRRPYLRENLTDNNAFLDIIGEKYLNDDSDYWNDIAMNDDGTDITAIRFVVQTYNVLDSDEDKNMMLELRKIASAAPFEVVVFHPFFVFFDQYLLVRTTSIQTISYAAAVMMIVSLFFIPSPLCSLWVAFSIVSIEIGVVGYMSLWEVNLDSVSMINLIMCIGFSVDFSAHISYAYLTAKGSHPDDKVRECLYSLGLPVLQGGFSTIAGVVILYFAPSYIFQTFFKVVFLVIFFGLLHGLLLLPVMLSLLGPGSCSTKRRSSVMHIPNTIPHIQTPASVIDLEASGKRNPIHRDPIDPDKDLGLGSSGSSSQSSLNEENSSEESSENSRKVSLESGVGVSNQAFISDELEIERL